MIRSIFFLFMCAALFNQAFAMQGEVSPSSNLKIAFDGALGKIHHKFTEDENNVYIRVMLNDADHVEGIINEVVSTKKGFKKHFLGTAESGEAHVAKCLPFDELCDGSNESAIKLIKRLFGNIFYEEGFSE